MYTVAVDAHLPDRTGALSVVDSSFHNHDWRYGVDVLHQRRYPIGISPLVIHHVTVEDNNVKGL